ncbi:Cobalt-zinc-cadmium resistance protein CzcC [Paraburkholderia caffeinitolerans]|uniref:Cobalt-zinc-cadmium resistance protein CzcC n=1 Tax=Paraburkholderia caffeinitolerans TaxID=1723730 RepID=A0A6J5G7S3_9BURK|nr:TolC family protein [Paraburkholderia caffeinitolerans]CAB3792245.1 Cobalt-zinc-cadmium resistance protein CzcC [Paraburkholderia caffeinitolerans]
MHPRYIVAAALLVLSYSSYSQSLADRIPSVQNTPPALSLDDALGIAAASNPLLRSAVASANASSGVFMQAGARPNPNLSLLQEGLGGQDRTSTALVEQTIELGGKRRARLDVASYGRQSALASLDGQAAQLRAAVITAFYDMLAAQRQMQMAQESADIALRSADMADKRARAGKISPVESTKARVAAADAQIALASARTQATLALEKLANVTGSPEVHNRTVTGNLDALPEIEPLSSLQSRLDDAPLSRVAQAELLRSNARVSVEKARRIPDITVSAGMKRVWTSGIPDNQAVVGVSIPLPIFDTNKGAILEASHNAEKASADLDSEKARLRLELAQAWSSYENATQEARRLKGEVLPAAKQALEAMQRGFELGKFSFLDVLDAQRTLFQGQSQYVKVLSTAHQAHAEIGRLVGTPLVADRDSTTRLN